MRQPELGDLDAVQTASAPAVVDWALTAFRGRIAYACSFGAEGMVLIDMLARHPFRPRVLTIDTGRLPQETHELIQAVRDRYQFVVDVYAPDTTAVQELVTLRGPNAFYRGVLERRECCHVRKVEPLGRALRGVDAWLTGLRREQAPTRAHIRKVEPDGRRPGVLKIMPLADWTSSDVWAYIRAHDVPYNELHDAGYRSIGCAPCTRPIAAHEDERAGRWWWEHDEPKECGLHLVEAEDRHASSGVTG